MSDVKMVSLKAETLLALGFKLTDGVGATVNLPSDMTVIAGSKGDDPVLTLFDPNGLAVLAYAL